MAYYESVLVFRQDLTEPQVNTKECFCLRVGRDARCYPFPERAG